MNIKRYLAASIVAFLVFGIIDFIFDFFILMPINHALKAVWRPEMMGWLEPVLYLYAALLFVFIFTIVSKSKNVREGIGYGVLIGLLVSGILSFKQYALYPIPLVLAVVWFAEGMLQYILAGITTALIYSPKTAGNSNKGPMPC